MFFRYLATGESFTSLSYAFRVGVSTIHSVVTQLNEAVWKRLQPSYMPVPTTQKWNDISESFYDICKMPHCIGSLDGKHCSIKCPPQAGSQYYNYKHFHSIVLMAIADANSNFIMIDVGAYGRNNDSSIFNESTMGKAFTLNRLNVPNPREMPDTVTVMPFYLVGDEAFPLRNNLMRPYARRQLDYSKRIFNYRLSTARRTVECAFGILTKKFGIFQKSIATNVELAEASIRSACVLHNYIRQNEGDGILEKNFLEENRSVNDLPSLIPTSVHRGSAEAMKMRDTLKNYFISPVGCVPWQNEKINL